MITKLDRLHLPAVEQLSLQPPTPSHSDGHSGLPLLYPILRSLPVFLLPPNKTMAAYLDPSEKAKVDDCLRLPGLNFHQSDPVIDKKNIDLLIALGAIDTKRGRAGNQITVTRRLVFLYETVLFIHKENPELDINSDRFYAAALLNVSDKYRDVYKNLTPQSLRHVIEIYRKAFVCSGLKVISKSTEIQDNVDDSERARLEELVKGWMIVRGRERRNMDKKEVFHLFTDVNLPQQKPNETLEGYMLRLKHEFNQLNQDQHTVGNILSYVSDQRGERIDQLAKQNEEYEKLLDKRLERLDKNHDQIEEYEKLLNQRRERIEKQSEEINEYKIRVTGMQQVIDQYGEMFDNHDELVRAHAELDDKLTEATEMQAEIMELQIETAYRQDHINDKLDEAVKEQNEIHEMQNELDQEVRRTILVQGFVADRQDEIMRRQTEVMDIVREVLNRYQ